LAGGERFKMKERGKMRKKERQNEITRESKRERALRERD